MLSKAVKNNVRLWMLAFVTVGRRVKQRKSVMILLIILATNWKLKFLIFKSMIYQFQYVHEILAKFGEFPFDNCNVKSCSAMEIS